MATRVQKAVRGATGLAGVVRAGQGDPQIGRSTRSDRFQWPGDPGSPQAPSKACFDPKRAPKLAFRHGRRCDSCRACPMRAVDRRCCVGALDWVDAHLWGPSCWSPSCSSSRA
eukprot:7203284-Prymnesium_polylepis.1